jgi:hypothetical protein
MTWRLPFVLFLVVPLAQCAPVEQRDNSPPASLEGSVRRQVEYNWLLDLGMPGVENMEAEILVEMSPDGTVRSARIDESGNNGDPNWPKFAQSCRRAVLKSSPLRIPSSVPYEKWKRLTLVFNAKDMLGQ